MPCERHFFIKERDCFFESAHLRIGGGQAEHGVHRLRMFRAILFVLERRQLLLQLQRLVLPANPFVRL